MKPSPRTSFSKPSTFTSKLGLHFYTFTFSRLSTIQHPHVSASRKHGGKFTIQNPDVPPLIPSPFNPLISRRPSAAFSLTEVVIAMGVAAVAFTSIIALFPLGLNMSKESYEETQAALLAQTILADCRDTLTGSSDTYSTTSGFLIQVGSSNSPVNFSANYTNVTNFPSTIYIAYKQEFQTSGDSMLRPFTNSVSAGSFYTSGTPGAVAIAKINFSYCFAGLSSLTSGPKKADITIETPGDIPTEKRKQRIFSGGFE